MSVKSFQNNEKNISENIVRVGVKANKLEVVPAVRVKL